ncbi:MAG: winged helix-turn-helix domain-containing protein, partial [Pseudomonadota bacterium]
KPFSPREVVARVKAVLRRASPTDPASATMTDTALEIDEQRYVASYQSHELDLTPVEFRLLSLLAKRPGRVYPRSQMIDQIYTDGRVVSDRTVDSHIKNLRHKIHAATGRDDLIRSVYGVGYKLE